ncbi:FecR family protein [Rudaea sp.]|uniref:FecR family protein n=1 Tax=Rudaea sp. TaxID=2136325 RepID=UPI00322041BF
MKQRPPASTTAIQAEAEIWFVRLRAHDCSARERRAFDAWLAAAPEHAEAYAESERFWNKLDLLPHEPEAQGWRGQVRKDEALPRRYFAPVWGVALTAAIAAACVVFGLRPTASDSATAVAQDYSTAPGEQRELTLEDGSHLMLNTDTRVRVRIEGGSREVELLRGEALFDVAHEPGRPFRVRAGDISVADLGTSFNIRSGATDTEITLISGRAAVTRERGGVAVELMPGDQFISGATAWRKQSVADLAAVTDWSSGHLVFRAAPLRDVVAKMNRHGPGRLVIADRELEMLQISGDFRIGDPDALLHALQSTLPVRVEKSSDGETRLYSRR